MSRAWWVGKSAAASAPVQCAEAGKGHILWPQMAWCLVAVVVALGRQAIGAPSSNEGDNGWAKQWKTANPTWRGVHLSVQSEDQANALLESLPKLGAVGVNVVIAEVDYSFDFQSHPEVRASRFVTKAQASQMAAAAHAQDSSDQLSRAPVLEL